MDNTSEYGNKVQISLKLQTLLLEQMEENSELCDVSVIIGGLVQRAHWSVLISCPFFHALYYSGLKERREGKIILQNGDCTAMRSTIKFLYSGTIGISSANVQHLLECAEYLQIMDLKEHCNTFLERSEELKVDNCVRLTLLCSQYDLDYYTRAYRFFSGHLTEILQQDAMLQLTADSVSLLICDETLRYVPRKTFFEFLVAWTKQDIEDRGVHFPKLFCGIDVTRLDLEYLRGRVLVDELVLASSECLSTVNAEIECQTSLSDKDLHVNDIILTASIQSDNVSRNVVIYTFQPFDNAWTEFPAIPEHLFRPIFAFGAQMYLYVVEGGDRSQMCTDTFIYKLDVRKKATSWNAIYITLPRSMSIRGILWCGGRLFCVASFKKSEVSNDHCEITHSDHCELTHNDQCEITILEIDESEGGCKRECSMFECSAKRSIQSCCFCDKFICVTASQETTNFFDYSPKFLIYDVQCGQVLDKSVGCSGGPILCNIDDRFLITGLGETYTHSFAIDEMCWVQKDDRAIPKLPLYPERTGFSYVYYHGCFYVIGGTLPCGEKPCDQDSLADCGASQESEEHLLSVFKYDFEKMEWVRLCDLPKAGFVSGACAVRRPRYLESCHDDCPHCLHGMLSGIDGIDLFDIFRTQAFLRSMIKTRMLDDENDDDDDYYCYDDSDDSDYYISD